MKEIALHIMDIAENSVTAGAKRVAITVEEDVPANRLSVCVQDDGNGMSAQMLAHVTDPFVTSRKTRIAGLGIPFLKSAAEECNGHLYITSESEKGTCLVAEFERDHIDRMPLGDLAGTMLALLVSSPETHWLFRYCVDGKTFVFDSAPIKRELNGVPFTEPTVLRFLREMLQSGIRNINCKQ
jgi:anti-sigma regulatory factor (Ser/Thr protein kinase)